MVFSAFINFKNRNFNKYIMEGLDEDDNFQLTTPVVLGRLDKKYYRGGLSHM